MTSDTQYLQRCWDRQAASGRIVIPAGQYDVDAPLDWRFTSGVLDAAVDCLGVLLNWRGAAGTVVKLGGRAWNMRWRGLSIEAKYPGPQAGVVGVEISNVQASQFDFSHVNYCDVGVRIVAAGRLCAFNTLRWSQVLAKTCIQLQSDSYGCNANVIRDTHLAGGLYPNPVYLDSADPAGIGSDTWKLFNVSYEGQPGTLDLTKGYQMEFHGCRWETTHDDRFTVKHAHGQKPYVFGGNPDERLTFVEV
jgi:hypothetical protein